jgi:hypothetical protein
MSKSALLENFTKKGMIAIKPLVQKTPTSMGLENHGLVVFPKTNHSEPMIYKKVGEKRIFVNGLDENHISVLSLSDEKAKAAKIKLIRETVAYLENKLHYSKLDINDENFWDNVKTFRPDNADYFGKIRLSFTNDDKYLFPDREIEDLILYHSILAGGFSMCSSDIEKCRADRNKWFLSIETDIEKIEVSSTRLRNQAIVSLEELYNKNNDRLFYVVKVLIPDATRFKKSSSRDSMYSFVDEFLKGNKHEKNVLNAVEQFRKVLAYDNTELIARAMLADCSTYRLFVSQNNMILHKDTGKTLGSTTEEVVQFLLNPLNQEFHLSLFETLKEKYW